MLRLHFSPDDLARVRLGTGSDPLWDVALAAQAVQDPTPGLDRGVRQWRRAVAGRLGTEVRPLLELAPAGGGLPDFLTPGFAAADLHVRLEEVLDTPTAQIREELDAFFTESGLTPWCRRLSGGSARARHELRTAVLAFHHHTLVPWQRRREQWLAAEQARWSQRLTNGGLGALLADLMPRMTWEAPRLVYRAPRADYVNDVDLAGRGLTLVPSRFAWQPMVLDVPGPQPVLVVPSHREVLVDPVPSGLADLLGRTRATVLAALDVPSSTTELSRRAGVSLASASEHARVLRGSGLVATERVAGAVRHSLTPLGRRLLAEDRDDRARASS